MQQVIKIFCDIIATGSKNEKQAIITANSENELFKTNLKFLLDSQIITGISKKKLNKRLTFRIPSEAPFTDWSGCMKYLKKHNTGSDHDIYWIQHFLKSIDKNDEWFYTGMITKSLKIGCDSKTANKAMHGFIKVYETQQAYPISAKNEPKNNEWFSISEKINGTNCGILNGECVSRQGKIFSNLNHIIEEINKLGLSDKYVNGELVRNNYDNRPDDENFQLSISCINSDNEDKSEIDFIFYEILTLDEFYTGKSKKKYQERLAEYFKLQALIEELGLKHIRFVNHFYCGTDKMQIQNWLDYADSHNMEGCMVNKNTYWENKRNNGILKVKSFKSCDIRCTEVIGGEGKYSNTLGRIICDYKGFELGVGSGFTDQQRDFYWRHPEEIVGKIVTVKYKTETKNKNGGISVQFPVFICVRSDKYEVSMY